MENKKKYHGGFILFFLVLLELLFINCSYSFANTSQLVMTSGELDTFFDAPNRVGVCSYFANTNSSSVSYFNSLLNRIGKERFLTFFNSNVLNSINANSNLTGINLMKQQITFIFDKGVISSQNSCRIHVFISNNSIGNDFGHLKLTSRTNFYRLSAYTDNIYYCVISIDFSVSNNLQVSPTAALNPGSSGFDFYISQILTRNDRDLISISGFIGYKAIQSIYYNDLVYLLNDNIIEYVPEPDQPSGESGGLGYITNPSGENGGNINLEPINQSLNNIQNQISGDTSKIIENQNQNTQTIVNAISGETEKITNTLTDSADNLIDNTTITSGDIENALNFEIAQDPYSNFWLTLTNNLKSALLGTKRSIDISFQGRTWTISLDEYMVLPAWLVIILTPFSTAFFTWVLVRQFKLIFNKLASGNVDSLLKENSEERHF